MHNMQIYMAVRLISLKIVESCLGCVWVVFGLCLGCVWVVFGLCLGCVWVVFFTHSLLSISEIYCV